MTPASDVTDGTEATEGEEGKQLKGYLILIAYEHWDWLDADEATRQYFFDAHNAFSAYVKEHGREVASAALDDPGTATTLRREGGSRGGRVIVSDGPFAETAETIGGYYEVALPDIDAAIAAASLLPASYTLEIRPTVAIT